jgi:hypothetical protein
MFSVLRIHKCRDIVKSRCAVLVRQKRIGKGPRHRKVNIEQKGTKERDSRVPLHKKTVTYIFTWFPDLFTKKPFFYFCVIKYRTVMLKLILLGTRQ